MTQVAAELPETTHEGDGVTTSFLIGFTLPAGTPLAVTVDGVAKTVGVAYDVVGSNVVFVTAPADGAAIAWRRRTPVRQLREFPSQPTMKPLAVEGALNDAARIAQEHSAELGRTVTAPVGETGPTLEPEATRDGRLAYFDGGAVKGLAPTAGRAVGWDGNGALTAVPVEVTVNGSVASIGSRVEAAFVTFTAAPAFLRTEGFAAAGDGGGGLHQPVEADPGHLGAFQSADGQWWEYVPEPGGWVNAKAFGGKDDGTGDMGPIVQSAADYARGRAVTCSGPLWRFATGVVVKPSAYPLDDLFAAMPVIHGDGPLETTFESFVEGGATFSFDTDADATDFLAGVGGGLRGVMLLGQGKASGLGQSGLKVRGQVRPHFSDLLVRGFDVDNIAIEMLHGDKDASNMPVFDRVRTEFAGRWGFNSGPPDGEGNEISFLTARELFVHGCGTNELQAVTGASNAAAMVLTVAGHGLTTGDRMRLYGFTGGFAAVNLVSYEVTVLDADTFSVPVDSTGFGAFASVAAVGPHIAGSGGINAKGQETRLSGGITECENVSIQVPGGGGLASGFHWEGAVESPKGVGILVTGLRGGQFKGQIYAQTNLSGGQLFAGLLCDGGTHVIDHVEVRRMKMRATSHAGMADYVGFARTGLNADVQTIRVRETVWDSWGFTGHKRFLGIQFDPTPTQVEFYFLSDTLAGIRPTGRGNGVDVRLRGPIGSGVVAATDGEWVYRTIGPTDVLKANTGLAINTRYYAYAYDAAATFGRVDLDFSTTAPALDADSGKLVKSDDATRRYVGGFETDGDGKFKLTAAGWLNALRVPSTRVGEDAYLWADGVGELRISPDAPTSDTDGTVVGDQTGV